MYKIFITGLTLGFLFVHPSLKAGYALFEDMPTVDSVTLPDDIKDSSGTSASESYSPPLSLTSSDIDSPILVFRTFSKLSEMSPKDRAKLAKRLDSHKSLELEKVIPPERVEAAIQKDSCCFVFWKICFKVSAKTLGSLAIDIILDLSDGNLNGIGAAGPVNYIHHIVEIINATIEEVMNETHKK